MKVSQIAETLKKFTKSHYNAILIDGPWGVGKTYYIRKFLDEHKNKKNYKIAYVSMFGKNSIDEIHTVIYSQLSPVKHFGRNIVRTIPSVANIVPRIFGMDGMGDVLSGLDFILKINPYSQDSQKNNKDDDKKNDSPKTKIAIIDDLERAEQQMSFTEILGYFNSLLMQGIKIIVVCNSKEIEKQDEYKKFTEKVFDREYKITATTQEVINYYFTGSEEILNKSIINEFDNNLRIAKRVSDFYNECLAVLQNIDKDYALYISHNKILQFCTYIVVDAYRDKYKNLYKEDKENNFELLIGLTDVNDDFIFDKYKYIMYYIRKVISIPINYFDNAKLYALIVFYHYGKVEDLESEFNRQKESTNPFDVQLFFASDEDKQKHFKKQIEYILSAEKVDFRKMITALQYMYIYPELSKINDYEDMIVEHLSEYEEYDEEISNLTLMSNELKPLDNFAQKLEKAREKKRLERCVRYFSNCAEQKDYVRLSVLLAEIYSNNDYLVGEKYNKRHLCPEILDVIKKYNYFFDDLDGTISGAQWEVAQHAATIARKNDLSNDALKYLHKLDWHSSYTAQKRYEYLESSLLPSQK